MEAFPVILGQAYYNQGFINIRKFYSPNIGADKSPIIIQLGNEPDNTINGYINRTANPNGTPRIMGGQKLTSWIHNNFEYGELLYVQIIDSTFIKLFKKVN